METCLRRSQRMIRKAALDPGVQRTAKTAAWAGSGFFLSAAALNGGFQPLALGLITAATGWRALVAAVGAAAGYRVFWGEDGILGSIWAALGCLFALTQGKGERAKEFPLLMPMLAAAVTAVSGLGFLFFRRGVPLQQFFLRLFLAPVAAWLFRRAFACRESVTEWVLGGIAVLSLGGLGPLGYMAAGAFSVWGSFPAAAMAVATLTVVVVFPTPPLRLATAKILGISFLLFLFYICYN